ncbi:MAG: hypothetical protein NUV50_07575 [Rhodospirillales bacterium]|nr:hypothetical protein [Rhodospirillales bacterium]
MTASYKGKMMGIETHGGIFVQQRKIDDLIRDMRGNVRDGRSTALLIGAGCSKEAGIPLASEFVQEIKKAFPDDYEQAEDKASYAHCMGALRPDDRHKLISEYIDGAKINRAHIAIAQLMKRNFVDRVLTTNFDPLVVRAGALTHLFPAVYDVAASQTFSPGMVRDRAVFYLHGQRDGFVQYHLPDQFKKLENVLGPLFSDTNAGRTWVVAGYSGENDPVFKKLAELHDFGCRLYWVTRDKDGPAQHVKDALGGRGKAAYWIHASDADTFFYKLSAELGCMPPEFFATPFTHLKSVFSTVADVKMSGSTTDLPWLDEAMEKINEAIEKFEAPDAKEGGAVGDELGLGETVYDIKDAMTDVMAGRYDVVISNLEGRDDKAAFAIPLSWAYIGLGDALSDQAKQKTGAEADELFEQAYSKYTAAMNIKPNAHNALNNWGNVLNEQAQQKAGAEADKLFEQAIAKYEATLEIKPDTHEALYNWGGALSAQAKQKTGVQADELFEQAYSKYAAALNIKPDTHEALNNWGGTLLAQAQQKTGVERQGLFAEAETKCLQAEATRPGKGAYNLACIAALMGKEKDCQTWLEKSLQAGTLPDLGHLNSDADLDPVRGEPWFTALLQKAKTR